MSNNLEAVISEVCAACGNDSTRMMDIVRGVQEQLGCVPSEAMDLIAKQVNSHRVEVDSVVSFYAFLSDQKKGKIVIRLCDDIVDRFQGLAEVEKVFVEELGIQVGETSSDGTFTLEHTPCIGMCDQAPAALINDTVVVKLTAAKAKDLCAKLKSGTAPTDLVTGSGDGNNGSDLVKAEVNNNIMQKGEVVFGETASGEALKKALAMSPAEVIRDVKTARLRGRGGAGFPAGMKWDFTRGAPGEKKTIICNADEGEPGTFKDRVVLTELADALFEGMTIAGYAIGADEGILYLRAEYMYLKAMLEDILAKRRTAGLLGNDVSGKAGFSYDIRIQMGAGAYICGEETALISSCEGLRGDPKNRPPFPAQKGYLGRPTAVNNVETYVCVTRCLDKGPGWFAQTGSKGSSGTKLISVSGDVEKPGVYEIPFGTKLSDFLALCGATETLAVQVGGPSGTLVGEADFERTICYDDLATGGSMIVFNKSRDILEVADYFMEFFIEESCGYCTPCRAGNVLLKKCLDKIRAGKGEPSDLEYLEDLGKTVKTTSRCGLGQTSAHPILWTLKNFRDAYTSKVKEVTDGMQPSFDLAAALCDAEVIAEHKSVHA